MRNIRHLSKSQPLCTYCTQQLVSSVGSMKPLVCMYFRRKYILFCLVAVYVAVCGYALNRLCKSTSTTTARTNKNTSIGVRKEIWKPNGDASVLIVVWTKFFNTNLTKRLQSYATNSCRISDNRSLAGAAHAVLFHIRDMSMSNLPPTRHADQYYIFYNHIPPYMSYLADDKRVPGALARLNGYFNLTWTYRTDSDIVGQRFGSAARLKSDPLTGHRVPTMSTRTLRSLVFGKRKLIAWVVSKCSTPSRREAIVLRLQRYLSIDIYGGCADYFGVRRSTAAAACPPLLNSDGAVNDDACEAMLADYKFYIAFENSVCRDYVTEKFFRIAQYVVPVVMRWRDYADLAPNGSYIAVDQFVTVQALAEHLLYLDRTPQAYMSYFKWHELMYMSSRREDLNVVELCTRLLSKGLPERKIYSNLSDWWNTQGNCELDLGRRIAH